MKQSRYTDESLELRRSIASEKNDYQISRSLENLARVLEATDRYSEAETIYRECLEISRQSRDRYDVAECLERLILLSKKKGLVGLHTADIEALEAEYAIKSDFISPEGFARITRRDSSDIYVVQNTEFPGNYKFSLAFTLDDWDQTKCSYGEPLIINEEDKIEFLGTAVDYFIPKAPLWELTLELVRYTPVGCGLLPIIRAAEKLKSLPPEKRVVQTLEVLETAIADYHRRRVQLDAI